MKKLSFLAVCVMALMFSCKQKGQTAPADTKDSVTTAVIDSIIEEADTTPMPMFLMGSDGKYMLMVYWTGIEEPQKTKDNEDYFDNEHQSWALQEMFRRNVTDYTNLIAEDNQIVKVKFIDEVLKDPDGNTPSIGELHGRNEIPSLSARFDYVNPKDKKKNGNIIVTDSYLKSRKQLEVKFVGNGSYEKPTPLPDAVIKQMEQKYGMKVSRSTKMYSIGDRYTWGSLQFKGEFKNAPKDPYDADRKHALALDVLIDSDTVYVNEVIGYMFSENEYTWNVDDDGIYISCGINAAFEGPNGLELCFDRSAPESWAVGMFYLRGGQLIQHTYETYHSMIDEEIPVWKRDLAQMDKIYHADDLGEKDVELTKWAHCYIDYENEWIWLRDKDNRHGAFFIRKDGQFQLMAIENPTLQPSHGQKDGIYFLKLAGPAGGPSWQQQIHAFKDGKRIWTLFVLEIEGEISECALNGKDISKEEGKIYLGKVPAGEQINAYFKNINGENE